MQQLSTFRLPERYVEEALELFSNDRPVTPDSVAAAAKLYERRKGDERIGRFLLRSALEGPGMELEKDSGVDWEAVGETDMGKDLRKDILEKVKGELGFHEDGFDSDLFFAAYLLDELREGKFGATTEDREEAEGLLDRVEERYPGAMQRLRAGGRAGIEEVAESYEPVDEVDEEPSERDDLPFE